MVKSKTQGYADANATLAAGKNASNPLKPNVYQSLRELLLSGSIEPGQRLIQQDLAKRLGTTTTPLREALRKLEAEGLVETVPGFSGIRTKTFDIRQLRDESVLRQAIECEAVRICVETAADEELRQLRDIAYQCDERIDAPAQDLRRIDELDYRFHHGLIKTARAESLARAFERFNIMKKFFRFGRRREIDRIPDNHRAIADRLMARDADGATRALRRHIQSSLESNIRTLRQEQIGQL